MSDSSKKKPKNSTNREPNKALSASSEIGLSNLAFRLAERVKELNCLYGISRLFENERSSTDNILQGVVKLIPPAWQFPDITYAIIKLKDKEFKTPNFRKIGWKQSQEILVDGKPAGVIEVGYLGQKPNCDEGPFLKEERDLIRVIAERLGHIIEHKNAEDNLKSMYHRERELHEKLQIEMKRRIDLTRKLIHELKTPLTSLLASSQMLCDEEQNQKLVRLAKYIWQGANSLNNRIEELHDLNRGETGSLKLILKKVNIRDLLHSLVERSSALSQQYGMTIELDIEGRVPIMQADPERISQIILNLINNACKYAKSGKRVIIKARREEDTILLEVKDFGPGITGEKQKTLFDPAYQLTEKDDLSGGLGIGLILCKMLVELHGGRIWFKGQAGKGSSFFFTIPIRRQERQPIFNVRGQGIRV